ncbi:Endoribonuclease L-PSP [Sarocladium strictum]
MSRVAVLTESAPKPRPVYSQAIIANGLVFCSGQLPKDLDGNVVSGTVQDKARQCIANLKAVLEAAGSSLEKVVEVNIFLTDMDDFARVNEVYEEYWGEPKPARTCVAVKTLPSNVNVEMKCIGIV